MFEQIILENSSEKQAKLLGPAQRAHKKPDIGVEIQNKFTYDNVTDFLKRAEKKDAVKQLKHIIVGDIRAKFDTTVSTSTNFDYSMEEEDIYKYYSDTEETEDKTVVEQEMTEEEMLLKFFDVDPNKL